MKSKLFHIMANWLRTPESRTQSLRSFGKSEEELHVGLAHILNTHDEVGGPRVTLQHVSNRPFPHRTGNF